ncbi:hypothetical protein F5Y15DRAFT_422561 [Xylariaceae sp. FL0016]|nr:hypothetical protein F5Y15DRAFT_422561 [Xylariaceae sp. FL0016]
MRPKLSLIIPPNRGPKPRLIAANTLTDAVDQTDYLLDTALSWKTCNQVEEGLVCCDHCLENGIDHETGDYDHAGLWRRCTENEGTLAVLEFFIDLQMRLLSILVPLLFLFMLRVYLCGYVEGVYGPNLTHKSIVPMTVP